MDITNILNPAETFPKDGQKFLGFFSWAEATNPCIVSYYDGFLLQEVSSSTGEHTLHHAITSLEYWLPLVQEKQDKQYTPKMSFSEVLALSSQIETINAMEEIVRTIENAPIAKNGMCTICGTTVKRAVILSALDDKIAELFKDLAECNVFDDSIVEKENKRGK